MEGGGHAPAAAVTPRPSNSFWETETARLLVTCSHLHIAGTGSFAAEIAEFAQAAGHRVVALVELLDDARVGSAIHDLPVVRLGPPSDADARIAIGVGGDRLSLARRLDELGWRGVALVHPAAHVSGSATVGDGAVAGPGVVVGARAAVGAHSMLGRGVLVGHHTRIGTGVTLNPGANVAGNCTVGDGAFVGMGAVVVPGVQVGEGAVVGAAALVLQDVPAGERVQGVPAVSYRRVDARDATSERRR